MNFVFIIVSYSLLDKSIKLVSFKNNIGALLILKTDDTSGILEIFSLKISISSNKLLLIVFFDFIATTKLFLLGKLF